MKKTVLLGTNNLLTYETLCPPLERAGCEVVLMIGGRKIIERCTAVPQRLVILDLDWPSDGGPDAQQVIRRILGDCPGLPIIVISGRSDLSASLETLGVAAIAEKPIDVPGLVETTNRLLADSTQRGTMAFEKEALDFQYLPPNSGAFREAFWQRMNAPFQITSQPRSWRLYER